MRLLILSIPVIPKVTMLFRSMMMMMFMMLMTSSVMTSSLDDDLTDLEWTMSQLPHHRTKRFLFLTDEKRLVLPPGTQLVLTPTLAMPFLRYPPDGLNSNITISTPFTIGFDAMGLTDNQNPFGLMPFFNPFIFGRRKRAIPDPEIPPHKILGGERAFLYEWVEDYLFTFGIDGKPCLLRAICESHESPLLGYGFMGEMLHVFLTPSKSPYSNRLNEYIGAEVSGREEGECFKYYKDCSRSLFKLNKYSKEAQHKSNLKHVNLEDFLTGSGTKKLKHQLKNTIMK